MGHPTDLAPLEEVEVEAFEGLRVRVQEEVSHYMEQYVGNGTRVTVLMVLTARDGMSAKLVLKQVSWARSIRLLRMKDLMPGLDSRFSSESSPCLSLNTGDKCWVPENHFRVHKLVKESGMHNFEGCRIPVPTNIRYDRIRAALGNKATTGDLRILDLLEFGMPIDCDVNYGIKKCQKNHFSAVGFKAQVSEFFEKGVKSGALLGPFESSPIQDLCFSPLMTVPKEGTDRRVIVNGSPGKAINDEIPKSTYLDFEAKFCLPSV